MGNDPGTYLVERCSVNEDQGHHAKWHKKKLTRFEEVVYSHRRLWLAASHFAATSKNPARAIHAMKDLTSSRLIILKGILMLLIGLFASAILLWENPSLRVALLLGVALWGFMRFYYFDVLCDREIRRAANTKISGLRSFASYLLQRRKRTRGGAPPAD